MKEGWPRDSGSAKNIQGSRLAPRCSASQISARLLEWIPRRRRRAGAVKLRQGEAAGEARLVTKARGPSRRLCGGTAPRLCSCRPGATLSTTNTATRPHRGDACSFEEKFLRRRLG